MDEDDDIEVTVEPAEVLDQCTRLHPSREHALAVARRMRAGGWVVPIHDVPVGPRANGSWVVAVVYHPMTFTLVGEVRYRPDGE